MKKTWFITLFLGVAMIASASFASSTTPLFSRENFTIGKGDLETDFGLDVDIFRGDVKAENLQLTLGANYFVTDIVAPGLELEIGHVSGAGTSAKFLPNVKLYWPLHNRFNPYFQAGVGYAHVPGADLFDFSIGPGFNYMLSNTVAIGMQFRYDLGTGNGTIHQIQFPINFSIYFKI